MNDVAFQEFSAYTRHVDVLCFSIEAKVRQAETESMIHKLLLGANDTARVLSQVIYASEELRQQHAQALVEAAQAHKISHQLVQEVTTVKEGLHEYSEGVKVCAVWSLVSCASKRRCLPPR